MAANCPKYISVPGRYVGTVSSVTIQQTVPLGIECIHLILRNDEGEIAPCRLFIDGETPGGKDRLTITRDRLHKVFGFDWEPHGPLSGLYGRQCYMDVEILKCDTGLRTIARYLSPMPPSVQAPRYVLDYTDGSIRDTQEDVSLSCEQVLSLLNGGDRK